MAWRRCDARRFSSAATLPRHESLWRHVANSWHSAGYPDDHCIREACRAVTRYKLEYERYNKLERIPRPTGKGAQPGSDTQIPTKIRAAAALRRRRLAARKRHPAEGGE